MSMKGGYDNSQLNLFDSDSGTALSEYKTRLERLKLELLKFGLSPNQAKVYIYLGKYGAKSAPEVCKSLSLPRTETYTILNALQNRGIVNAEFSSPTRYSALPIEKTISAMVTAEQEKLDTLAKQEVELAELWHEIPAFIVETNETKTEKLQMIPGSAQIHTKIKEMIQNSKEEILMFGTETDLSRFYHSDIIEILSNSTLDVKIIISPSKQVPHFVDVMARKRVKILPDNKKNNQCFVIKDHDEILLFLRNATHPSHNVFALWADSKSLIDSMHTLFGYSWESAEGC